MATGKVKWFNNEKGYGFINEDGRTEDVFVHYSKIRMDGFKTLKAGQQVIFDIIQAPKGLHAENILIHSNDASPIDAPQCLTQHHHLEV
ncbi:cold shock domain-containing protein [Pseudomonas sp. RP23018S]|uniref:cold shock domain-containing protein n=1 Tax=Pseudomonas sp. RP23018S TaxID=3096037 RepID=UPI002ACAFFEB|nr:cold shock domain-containing protein [Pseudomonas sp. RP23018S]MDZ5602419.1 cold shock domain-containing protein [Pseudomonas sp. RP23018S]